MRIFELRNLIYVGSIYLSGATNPTQYSFQSRRPLTTHSYSTKQPTQYLSAPDTTQRHRYPPFLSSYCNYPQNPTNSTYTPPPPKKNLLTRPQKRPRNPVPSERDIPAPPSPILRTILGRNDWNPSIVDLTLSQSTPIFHSHVAFNNPNNIQKNQKISRLKKQATISAFCGPEIDVFYGMGTLISSRRSPLR